LSHDQVIGEFGTQLIHHDGIDDVFSAAMGNYGYVLRGTELEPLVAAAHRIQAKAA
jgi:hypothetical protein